MSESRLERLLKLIDTAQSPAYRRLAAKQLGNLVQSQPNQARPLLKMLDQMIFSKNWDTRVACAFAIEYTFTALPAQFKNEFESENVGVKSGLLSEMDLAIEIKSRKALLSSAGSEFDLDLTISAAERLKIGRANMKKTLGLGEISGMDELERELVKDEDLTASSPQVSQINSQTAVPVVDLEKLSARERIAMKRKARLKPQAPPSKLVKKSSEESLQVANDCGLVDGLDSIESDALWFCEKMKEKLLNPNWQVRHGALLGLRGVLGRGLPVLSSGDSTIISESWDGWIDFLLCDILLVLGLDRFGDFIGDQVVSPVKETAAQLFSLIYKRLGEEKRNCLVSRHLRSLMNFEEWQVRHAGLLSLKHILANVSDVEIACQLSDRVIDLLCDEDEDVRSVAAEVLCSLLSSKRGASIDLERIFKNLQGLLSGLDELSPSVAAILDLLGQLVNLNSAFGVESSSLIPFLRHSSTKVRKQVIKVLGAIRLDEGKEICQVLIQLIQSMAVELDREVNDMTLSLVLDLITISSSLSIEFEPKLIDNLFEIVSCPLGVPYSLSNFKYLNGPADHDLAFKKSDMMLISEEDGILQRINVSSALSAIINMKSKMKNVEDKKENLSKSQWVIHHLVHYWIFGPIRRDDCNIKNFNELSGISGSLLSEFNRFTQNGCSSLNLNVIKSAIKEFNTRTEKSVEALNQLGVLEGVLKEFEGEQEKLMARFKVCHISEAEEDSQGYRNLLNALKIESNSRLQEFYCKELSKTIEEAAGELINLELLQELGDLMNLKRLVGIFDVDDRVISVKRDWTEYFIPDDTIWRGGRFLFKEFGESSVIVGKSLSLLKSIMENDEKVSFLAALGNEIKTKAVAELFIENFTLKSLNFFGNDNEFSRACAAFAFALLVRLEFIARGTVSEFLERFLHEILFKGEAQEVFPIILELLNRSIDNQVIIPIIPVLLKRTLMEINDSNGITRKFASLTFSQLVKLAPLAYGDDKVSNISLTAETEKLIGECKEFLDQLQGPSTALPDFVPPCKLNVEMRPYQQAGLNWLAFLRRFNLHGALCDDMGLGKTLQTLSIIASDHYEIKDEKVELKSLIVCPASLTGHWEAEVKQYCPTLKAPLVYVGPSAQRHSQLKKKIQDVEIVITSYDVLRSDSEWLTGFQWNYCVLDEGHLIKNPRTKLSAAVRGIKAKRRLLLSGTPIQNNLLELWALFDFLLPGYLGNEKEFSDRYAKPILILQHQQSTTSTSSSSSGTTCDASSLGKWTQKDFDEAEGKLESLHKQVLPFILRRMKEDVLKDLPPKIIQDYKCPMSSIQRILYDDLLRGSNVRSEISKFVSEKFKTDGVDDVSGTDLVSTENHETSKGGKPTHVFQVLQYLRKLCVHPSLVLSENNEPNSEIEAELKRLNLKMNDLAVAPKFQMLKELLVECGLGDSGDRDSVGGGGNHRVLIFAQHKSTLDLIEEVVFRPHLPGISFLRLDGRVEPSARYPIVSKFNTDMTIDVLLLTTHVGGLGLNLTSADTVIFMDPDWNPMKDLQAMDRAHRLGQKRVVTVYRLLLQDTLEDRIMSLQRWKTRIAGTVITQQNSEATNHENLLDLFDDNDGDLSGNSSSAGTSGKKSGLEWHREDDSDLAAREAEYQEEFHI